MQLRGHGNGIAIALAALAVVIAGTGTAVAVTAQVVNIADPAKPSQVARVDSTGRLKVGTPTSTLNAYGSVTVATLSPDTSPTSATLAISRVAFYNPQQNASYAHTDVSDQLVEILPGSDGSCFASDATYLRTLSVDHTPAGASAQDTYPAPLIVQPPAGSKYCLGAYAASTDGTNPGSYIPLSIQITGYVASGTYTGIGTNAHPVSTGGLRMATPAHAHGETVTPGNATTAGK